MRFSEYRSIVFCRDGRVLHATFNRPDKLNAMDEELQKDCIRMFEDVGHDEETNVLVLTGAGRAFSAGGDISYMQQLIDSPSLFLDGMVPGRRLLHSILDCAKPIIAKVNGPAIGLGATIALFCDLIVARNDAKIGDPHVKTGLVAGDGGAAIWPQLIGYARAKEYLMLGDLVSGEEAARIGLINRAVPAEELDGVVNGFAQRLASGASRAIQWTKLSLNLPLKAIVDAVVPASFAYEALSNQTKDHQEAVHALRDKRPARFTGE